VVLHAHPALIPFFTLKEKIMSLDDMAFVEENKGDEESVA
jgi:hypothetical protein